PDLLHLLPEATYLAVFIDLNVLEADFEGVRPLQNTKIRILHSPSAMQTKGSAHIHQILATVKEHFGDQVELILPAKDAPKNSYTYALTRHELLETFVHADIVIDQMVIGWYGLKSIE